MISIQKKIERITELAREKEQLANRLGEIDAELEEMIGGGRTPTKRPQKVRGGGNAKERPAKKGGVKHECCGSKQNRHKKGCAAGTEEKPEPAPIRVNKPVGPEPTWECLECSTKVRSAEQPDKCPSCPGRTMIQK